MFNTKSKLEITLLSPTSAVKVFWTVKLYSSLDVNQLRSSESLREILLGNKYTPIEKYFIVFYIKEYLELSNKKSYIKKVIEDYDDLGESEDLADWKNIIYDYVAKINTVIKSLNSTIYRRSIAELKYEISDYKDQTLQSVVLSWKKLPMIQSHRKRFVAEVNKVLLGFYSKSQVKDILNNGFSINSIDSSTVLLYLEFENSAEIYNAFHGIYKVYKELLQEDFQNEYDRIYTFNYKRYGERLNTDNHLKGELSKIKDYYLKTSDRINFARLMFTTFPQIRDTFIRKWNFDKLDDFLVSVSSNIAPRKK